MVKRIFLLSLVPLFFFESFLMLPPGCVISAKQAICPVCGMKLVCGKGCCCAPKKAHACADETSAGDFMQECSQRDRAGMAVFPVLEKALVDREPLVLFQDSASCLEPAIDSFVDVSLSPETPPPDFFSFS